MRRDTVKYIALLFCLTLVIPFLSGCNDTDDVQKIFTGKTWKMTYITKKNEHSWYKFTDVSEAIYKSYDPINGTKAFKIAFTGSTEDNIIRGEFSGRFCAFHWHLASGRQKQRVQDNRYQKPTFLR